MIKVLIVEDEALIAMLLEEMLVDKGFEVSGHASTLDEAEAMARSTEADVAILDVSLGGNYVFSVAEILQERNIPFVFTTGYGSIGIEQGWEKYPVFTKPYDIDPVTETLNKLVTPDG